MFLNYTIIKLDKTSEDVTAVTSTSKKRQNSNASRLGQTLSGNDATDSTSHNNEGYTPQQRRRVIPTSRVETKT